jgi:hypothetical protein
MAYLTATPRLRLSAGGGRAGGQGADPPGHGQDRRHLLPRDGEVGRSVHQDQQVRLGLHKRAVCLFICIFIMIPYPKSGLFTLFIYANPGFSSKPRFILNGLSNLGYAAAPLKVQPHRVYARVRVLSGPHLARPEVRVRCARIGRYA